MMLLFFIIIAVLLVVSLFIAMGTSIITIVADAIIPEIQKIGVVDGGGNISEYADYGLKPVNIMIDSLSWFGGVIYMIALFGLFGIAIGYKITLSKWLIGMYILLAIMIIIMSIFISNIYEDLYQDSTEFGENIREQTLLSFLILQAPLILSITIFASGIILFSGLGQEEGV